MYQIYVVLLLITESQLYWTILNLKMYAGSRVSCCLTLTVPQP